MVEHNLAIDLNENDVGDINKSEIASSNQKVARRVVLLATESLASPDSEVPSSSKDDEEENEPPQGEIFENEGDPLNLDQHSLFDNDS